MERSCNRCVNGLKEVTEEPCFKCMDTPNKKFWEAIPRSVNPMTKPIQENLELYKILKSLVQSSYEEKDKFKVLLQLKKAKEVLAFSLVEAIESGKYILVEKESLDGRLHKV